MRMMVSPRNVQNGRWLAHRAAANPDRIRDSPVRLLRGSPSSNGATGRAPQAFSRFLTACAPVVPPAQIWKRENPANTLFSLVPVERIELPTFGLQNRCSTAELNRLRY